MHNRQHFCKATMFKQILFAAFILMPIPILSQPSLPYKVEDIVLYDLHGNRVKLPYLGQKSLFIFYIDPDTGLSGNRNLKHADIIEQSGVLNNPKIFGFGILNLKDTFLPDKLIRSMARRRTAKNRGYVLIDPDYTLSDAWQIGDCNGKFCIMMVNAQGELVLVQKEEMSNQGLAELLDFVKQYW